MSLATADGEERAAARRRRRRPGLTARRSRQGEIRCHDRRRADRGRPGRWSRSAGCGSPSCSSRCPGIGEVRAAAIMETARHRPQPPASRPRHPPAPGAGDFRRTLRIPADRSAQRICSNKPRLTVLAGPTAVGKGTVSTYIRDNYPEVWLSVSATTRAPRPGEQDGVHYFFKSAPKSSTGWWPPANAGMGRGARAEPLRHAAQHGGRAPWPTASPCCWRSICRAPGRSRRPCRRPQFVFLAPPSWDEMVRRLVGRGTETRRGTAATAGNR